MQVIRVYVLRNLHKCINYMVAQECVNKVIESLYYWNIIQTDENVRNLHKLLSIRLHLIAIDLKVFKI